MSSIANCDWPDEYPELLTSLIALLSSGSQASVHGAMQVFTEFIKSDLTEDQILPVLRELLPVLIGILGSPEVSYARIHARTLLSLLHAGTLRSYARAYRVSFPPMCYRLVHGQGSASSIGERSHRDCAARVAGRVQGFAQPRSCSRCS